MNYFFDTYALVEIVKGNENYEKYSDSVFTTTTSNLAEFYFYLLSNLSEKRADEILKRFNFAYLDISDNVAIGAAKFRKKNYKRNLSYIDCVGYILSRKLGLSFLTGDEFFRNVEGVEFVE